MKTKQISLCVSMLALIAGHILAAPMGTAFTYQGQLQDGGQPANGSYDLRFALYDVAVGGEPLGSDDVGSGVRTNTATLVNNGLFTVKLDFGPGFFGGDARWLEIGVRTNGGGAFSTLDPRVELAPVPYAMAASNLTGTLPTSQLSGTLPSAQLGGTYSSPVTFNNAGNVFTGNGAGLVNLNPGALLWGSCPPWYTCGNAGTTVGANFLGTTDDEPLELKVFNTRALRLEPNGAAAPNIIGGSALNLVGAGSVGATISGGHSNSVWSAYATIGGGTTNSVKGVSAVIAGGRQNTIYLTSYASIGGGWSNRITEGLNADAACTIAGGARNLIDFESDWSTIGGGKDNTINRSYAATIAGGWGNRMLDQSERATISGGQSNQMRRDCLYSTIGGGLENEIGYGARLSTIAGGAKNKMGLLSLGLSYLSGATIGGGGTNIIEEGANYATVAGGNQNFIATNALHTTISGGHANALRLANPYAVAPTNSTIGGGQSNWIYGVGSVIGGGLENRIGAGTTRAYEIGHVIGGGVRNLINLENKHSTVGGGLNNLVDASTTTISGGFSNRVEWAGGSYGNTIGGGEQNTITSQGYLGYSVIAGGRSNIVSGNYGTVPGGIGNYANEYSFAAGRRARAEDHGVFVWADSTDADFASTANNQFLIRAGGGVGIGSSGPQADLHIKQSDNSYPNPTTGGIVLEQSVNSAKWQVWHSNPYLSFAREGVRLAYVDTSGNWVTTSDQSVKTDVQDLHDGILEQVLQLRPVSYRMAHQEETDRRAFGFIAQEVAEVMPELVRGEANGRLKSLAYSDFGVVAVKAIQELDAKVTAKDAEIAELKRELGNLKQLVNSLIPKQGGGAQ